MDKSILKNLSIGDIIEFGSYPQDLVTDNALCSAIDKLSGRPSAILGAWKDYNYSSGSTIFTDVEYMGKKYRSVYIQKHRMERFMYEFCDYKDRNIYRFSYEPIKWQVLSIDNDKALLLSLKALDTQDYAYKKKIRKEKGFSSYINNYKDSFVRAWLNGAFLDLAFTPEEQSLIELTTVKNDASTTKKPINQYACEDTLDKVFLLSFQEAKTLFADNKARYRKSTEYNKAQGCFAYRTEDAKYNNVVWMLRSPDSNYSNIVRGVGDGGGIGSGGFSCSDINADYYEAVVPAIIIKIL